jgi:hypothetical protein
MSAMELRIGFLWDSLGFYRILWLNDYLNVFGNAEVRMHSGRKPADRVALQMQSFVHGFMGMIFGTGDVAHRVSCYVRNSHATVIIQEC